MAAGMEAMNSAIISDDAVAAKLMELEVDWAWSPARLRVLLRDSVGVQVSEKRIKRIKRQYVSAQNNSANTVLGRQPTTEQTASSSSFSSSAATSTSTSAVSSPQRLKSDPWMEKTALMLGQLQCKRLSVPPVFRYSDHSQGNRKVKNKRLGVGRVPYLPQRLCAARECDEAAINSSDTIWRRADAPLLGHLVKNEITFSTLSIDAVRVARTFRAHYAPSVQEAMLVLTHALGGTMNRLYLECVRNYGAGVMSVEVNGTMKQVLSSIVKTTAAASHSPTVQDVGVLCTFLSFEQCQRWLTACYADFGVPSQALSSLVRGQMSTLMASSQASPREKMPVVICAHDLAPFARTVCMSSPAALEQHGSGELRRMMQSGSVMRQQQALHVSSLRHGTMTLWHFAGTCVMNQNGCDATSDISTQAMSDEDKLALVMAALSSVEKKQ